MSTQKYASEIIDRVEYLRNYLGLNKSRFSSEIGMKPQTYNNFIGSQGSKPSVDLIMGVVSRFGANPNWLLNGSGPLFQEGVADPRDKVRRKGRPWEIEVADGENHGASEKDEPLNELIGKIKGMETLLREMDQRVQSVEETQFLPVKDLARLFQSLHAVAPDKAETELKEMISRLEKYIKE